MSFTYKLHLVLISPARSHDLQINSIGSDFVKFYSEICSVDQSLFGRKWCNTYFKELFFIYLSRSKNAILISGWFPCGLHAEKFENFWCSDCLYCLFSGAHFLWKPSNSSP